MEIGNKIMELRKKKGLSQEQLGEKIDVTRQTISNWELGVTQPNPDQLKLLSKELATFLTGRYISIEMYPFSFNEFIDFKEELNQKAFFENEFNIGLIYPMYYREIIDLIGIGGNEKKLNILQIKRIALLLFIQK